ncbi:MAG UNVERIFIED_CONTAM: hypothetical protein LVR18_45930 [Planctomycetaceae bacterium]
MKKVPSSSSLWPPVCRRISANPQRPLLIQPFVDAVAAAGLGIEFPSVDDDGNPIPRYSRITGWDVATTVPWRA